LQVLTAFAYALVAPTRRFIAWLVVTLAIVAPAAALFAKLSGEAFRDRMIAQGRMNDVLRASIDEHNSFGNLATITSAALSVLMILLLLVSRVRAGTDSGAGLGAGARSGPGVTVLAVALTVAVLGAGGATSYYVFKTGDTGAKMVWTGQ
jgi:hypothetical protein